ncbi:hypothetical protein F4810DRAFT_117619 [Camillea tinctor]|nr:hypothetical protein F4810DRAFT_117619 [Camillea tinctor]
MMNIPRDSLIKARISWPPSVSHAAAHKCSPPWSSMGIKSWGCKGAAVTKTNAIYHMPEFYTIELKPADPNWRPELMSAVEG